MGLQSAQTTRLRVVGDSQLSRIHLNGNARAHEKHLHEHRHLAGEILEATRHFSICHTYGDHSKMDDFLTKRAMDRRTSNLSGLPEDLREYLRNQLLP